MIQDQAALIKQRATAAEASEAALRDLVLLLEEQLKTASTAPAFAVPSAALPPPEVSVAPVSCPATALPSRRVIIGC